MTDFKVKAVARETLTANAGRIKILVVVRESLTTGTTTKPQSAVTVVT